MPHIRVQPDPAAQLRLWSPAPVSAPGLAVDWWDSRARRWRPTILAAAGRTYEVLVPRGDRTATARVDPVTVRASELLTDALARHALTRSRLMLLLALAETAAAGEPALRPLVNAEFQALAEVRPAWVTAFRAGAERGLEAPPLPLPPGSRELDLPPLSPAARRRAAELLGRELQQVFAALLAAGRPEELAALHPQVAGLAALFSAASGEGVQAMGIRPSGVASVWMTGSPRRSGLTRNHI
jgi:hypothetical protein